MKKSLFLFCLVFCMLLSSVNIFAAETIKDANSSTNITVSFKTGTGIYTVNGKTVKTEASTLIAGRTYVPVNVITDALGATLNVDLKKKTAVINYNNVEVKLTENKKEAIIAGKTVKTDVAPFIKNSSFMVAISFLAETLGADVTNTKGEVNFIKEVANPNSILDYSTLIKKSNKEKVGDSYYNWSMLLPDDLKLSYRNFNGTNNVFFAQDESYIVDVDIFEKTEHTSLDNAINNLSTYTKDFTLIDCGKRKNNEGIEYVECVYKDDYLTYQVRVFISDTKEYDMHIITKNDDSYLDEKYQNVADSFKFSFDKDGSTEDLSDVSKDGYRKYQDSKLKWSINVHPDWYEYEGINPQNRVVFNGDKEAFFSVEVYSLDKGETLDSITQDEINQNEKKLNPRFYKLVSQENAVIGGVKCKKFYYTLKILDRTYYDCVVCFTDKNYKYILNAELSDTDYNNSKQKSLVDGMIESFTFSELNVITVGKLLDPDKVVLPDTNRNISEDLFSIEIPFNWYENENNNDAYFNFYYNSLGVTVDIYDGNSLYDFTLFLDSYFKEDSKSTIESKTYLTEKGMGCYKYVVLTKYGDYEYRKESYVIQKGSKIYAVTLGVDNLFYGQNTVDAFTKIWSSFSIK